ncbi:MAG: surface-adhesin E family protein [Gemmatimonadaceae bacterium]
MHSKIIPALAVVLACLSLPNVATAQKASKARKTAASTKSWTPSGAWRSVYDDPSVRVAVDTTQTRRQSDGTYKVRLRWQYASNQAIGTKHAYRTMVDRKLIDCSTQGIKPVSAETYDVAGKPVAGYDTPAAQVSEIDWAKRPPGSSAGKAYAAVCGVVRK